MNYSGFLWGKINMKVIIKINILSAAKISGILFGGVYLVAGVFINIMVLLFGIPAFKDFDVLGFGSGLLATFLVALLVGSISFILGAILGWLYNLAASIVGGIGWEEIEVKGTLFKSKKPKNPQQEIDNIINKGISSGKKESKKDDNYSDSNPNFLSS